MKANLHHESCLHCDSLLAAAKKVALLFWCLQRLEKPARKHSIIYFCTKNCGFIYLLNYFPSEYCVICFNWMEKMEPSPQPAFVEKDAPPLWIVSPPGAIICEGRQHKLVSFRHFVCLINEKNLHSEGSRTQHWPDSEFLLPMSPTKMSCSSPDNMNDSVSVSDFCFVRMQDKKIRENPFGL